MKIHHILILLALPFTVSAQKNKVQAAWRSLSDYESTLIDNPDVSYLLKAKENIDLATNHEETKNQFKTYAYRLRIYAHLFEENLKVEEAKLVASISDKSERRNVAYGQVIISEIDEANKSWFKLKELDSKKINTILVGESDSEDDTKLRVAINQIQVHKASLASGKYKMKKFDEASDIFESMAIFNTELTGKKDTSNFYNACVCAQKAKNQSKMLKCNQAMIDLNIASPYNYQTICEVNMLQNDSLAAIDYLEKGRKQFPNDVYLMNKETEVYLSKGQHVKALENLKIAIEKEPNNSILHYAIGNVYDNLANPKGKTGRDTIKPLDYDSLVFKATVHYQKAIDLKPANRESYFNSLYNLGALYNNYGYVLYNKSVEKMVKNEDSVKKQKEFEMKSMESYKKAIPFLEQALDIKPNDITTMTALKTLYYKIGNESKAKQMQEKIKTIK